jgi:glutathione S-transferase
MMRRNAPPDPDPERQRQREAEATRAEDEVRALYRRFEGELQGDYLCGPFTVADIALFMMILWSLRLSGPDLHATPALARWYARVGDRPSAAQAAAEIAEADRLLSPKR